MAISCFYCFHKPNIKFVSVGLSTAGVWFRRPLFISDRIHIRASHMESEVILFVSNSKITISMILLARCIIHGVTGPFDLATLVWVKTRKFIPNSDKLSSQSLQNSIHDDLIWFHVTPIFRVMATVTTMGAVTPLSYGMCSLYWTHASGVSKMLSSLGLLQQLESFWEINMQLYLHSFVVDPCYTAFSIVIIAF